jgi:membrane peptidoglycan carboxypeptidase
MDSGFSRFRRRRTYGDALSTKKPGRAPKPKRHWLKPLIIASIAFVILCFIGGTIMVAVISRELPDPQKLSERQVAQSTKIYDRTGEHLLYEVYQDQKRTMVELDKINPLAIKATIAVEDKNFYTHNGVRLVSIIRAGFNNLIGRKTGSGGASTLTQQLIKNTIVGDSN